MIKLNYNNGFQINFSPECSRDSEIFWNDRKMKKFYYCFS